MENVYKDVQQCHRNLQNKGVAERKEFGRYAVGAAHLYFEDGYSPEAYLGYYVLMAGLALTYSIVSHQMASPSVPAKFWLLF
ncbi:hypothetical protein TNIN_355431 [Trichonephila inaurata madagascariensis]|uniref:Uncharacterized protein n=1 Tax=Trichonephila inaurata madagascariensis TaxID=2747483 RepID=A0A8X6JQX4_9ARAC|nr:hypothetical protein TNIN_355431 [Trichonephila inaurata madagascariensis]